MSFTIESGEIADFIAAQDLLRQEAGTPVTFVTVPSELEWPGGTAINPDTDLPFDSTVNPVNSDTETTITCLLIEKQGSPLRPGADTSFEMSGMRLGMDIILDVAPADYEATVVHASAFSVGPLDFAVEEAKPFFIGGVVYRWLVYGAAK